MASADVYIALGSNLGDRLAYLTRAVAALPRHGLRVTGQSPVYETEPVGGPPQAPYLNAVVRADTRLSPAAALAALLDIERELGRVRGARNAPRVVDLDLLIHGEAVVDSPFLTVPHPRLAQRRFVLQPLADLAPSARHPGLGLTAAELLQRCPDGAAVTRWGSLPDPAA